MIIIKGEHKYDIPEEEVNKFVIFQDKMNNDFNKTPDSKNSNIRAIFFTQMLNDYFEDNNWGKFRIEAKNV